LDFVHRLIGYKNIKKHDVSEAGSAPVLMWSKEGEGGMTQPTHLGPLERTSLNHHPPLLHLRTEAYTASETSCFFSFLWNIRRWTKPKIPIILNINHRQNLLAYAKKQVGKKYQDRTRGLEGRNPGMGKRLFWSPKLPDRPGTSASLLFKGHRRLVSRLRLSGVVLQLSVCTFMAWTSTTQFTCECRKMQ
jgi:hypothetical protein